MQATVPAAILVTAVQTPLQAQETIATDRPGFAFSPITVPAQALQFEIGLPLVELADAGDVETQIVRTPVVALRYGLADRFELRTSSALYNRIEIDDGVDELEESGNGDLELGVKWHLVESGERHPDVSVIGSVFLPVGDDPFTISEDRAGFALLGVAGGAIGSDMSWITVAGASWLPDGDDEYTTTGNLVGLLGRSLADRVSGYVEAEWFPSDSEVDPILAGVGVTFLATPLIQLDAAIDRGLNDDATDWIFGAGISTRFFN
jgi:hypothetical protein